MGCGADGPLPIISFLEHPPSLLEFLLIDLTTSVSFSEGFYCLVPRLTLRSIRDTICDEYDEAEEQKWAEEHAATEHSETHATHHPAAHREEWKDDDHPEYENEDPGERGSVAFAHIETSARDSVLQ